MEVSHYLWADPQAAIEQVDVQAMQTGRLEALIYASPNAKKGELQNIPTALKSSGFTVLQDVAEDGRFCLRVTNFDNAEQLLGVLERKGGVPTPSSVNTTGQKPKRNLAKSVRDSAFISTGVFAVIGHLALVATGILRKDSSLTTPGIVFAATNGVYAIKGNGQQGGEVQNIVGDMLKSFEEIGIDIPDPSKVTPEELGAENGFVHKVWQKVTRPVDYAFNEKPFETGQIASLAANFMMAKGKEEAETLESRKWNARFSIMGGLVQGLIPAKPYEAKETQAGEASGLSKLVELLQDRSMLIGGFFQTLSNVAIAMSAVTEFKELKKMNSAFDTHTEFTFSQSMSKDPSLPGGAKPLSRVPLEADVKTATTTAYLSAITAATWLLSGGISMIASKQKLRDYDDQGVSEHVTTMCVNALSAVEPGMRDAIIDKMANYLGAHHEIKDSKEVMLERIYAKLEQHEQSPWQARMNNRLADEAIAAATSTRDNKAPSLQV
jgi:hypothetical protein